MLFQSPVKKPPIKLKKLSNLLKITKPTKLKVIAKWCGVRKQVAKTTTIKCKKGSGGLGGLG
jgi:hypothetical protein